MELILSTGSFEDLTRELGRFDVIVSSEGFLPSK